MTHRIAVLLSLACGVVSFGAGAAERDVGKADARVAVIWQDQALWYGVEPDIVTAGELFAAYLGEHLQGLRAGTAEGPVVYTILLREAGEVTEAQVGRTFISTKHGVAPLSEAEFERVRYFVEVRPESNRITRARVPNLEASSLAFVSGAF